MKSERLRRIGLAHLAICAGCGVSVSGRLDAGLASDGSIRADASGTGLDARSAAGDGATGVDRVNPPADRTSPPSDVLEERPSPPPPSDVPGDARGEWRLTTFRFSLMGAPTQITDVNRSLPSDPAGRWRINGILDVRSDRMALSWAILRNDHAFVSDPTVEIDEGYSATAFYWNGMLDDRNQRFVVGAFSLDFGFERENVLRLSSTRDGWTAVFVREPRLAAPSGSSMTLEGVATQVSVSTSDRFTQARVAVLWDLPAGARFLESSGAELAFSGGGVNASYRLVLPSIPAEAVGTAGGARVAFGQLVVYDDVDRNGRFDSALEGGMGPDIVRGVSPIALAANLGGTPTAAFDEGPFRLLKPGWQFVNVERNSDPRPAVLVPYAMTNPLRPDIPVSETRASRRILNLLP
jgi:hypothetical protein